MNVEINNSTPVVSVIMPVYNEEAYILESIKSLLSQDYPHEFLEILIADGMSSDRTREIVHEIAATSDITIRIIDNPQKIAPAGLNRAIENSNGEIIVRVDGHCEVESDYVSNCVSLLLSDRAEGVGGPIQTIGNTTIAKAIAIAMSSTFGVGGSAFRTIDNREIYVDTVAFPGYKKSVIEKAGLFNEELVRNQDDEYNYRIRKLGGRILLSPVIRSRYYSRSGLKSLWKQYFQYGYWKIRVLQLHPKQMSARQFVPFVFVLSLIMLGVLSIFFWQARFLLALEVVMYLVANTLVAAALTKRSFSLFLYVSASFAILHLSYGLGFLIGLFRFWNRWGKPASELEKGKGF